MMVNSQARFLIFFLGGSGMGENPHFWPFLGVFGIFLGNASIEIAENLDLYVTQYYLTPREDRMSGKNLDHGV